MTNRYTFELRGRISVLAEDAREALIAATEEVCKDGISFECISVENVQLDESGKVVK